jgi:hypothetical protein
MSNTNQKDSDAKPKKPSFWEKLSEKQVSGKGSSLVNAIVKQAEKEASELRESRTDKIKDDSLKTQKSRKALANSRTILGFTMLIFGVIWLYFFAMLHDSNYIHGKFDKENLTTEKDRKIDLSYQLNQDTRDVKRFNKLIRIENLASRILVIDLTDKVLNYQRSEGEIVTPRNGSAEALFKTIDENGATKYLKESEMLALEQARDERMAFIRKELPEIIAESQNLESMIQSVSNIEDDFDKLVSSLEYIDPTEENFPSAALKSYFGDAQKSAKSILKNIRDENLKNLVADIKKQAAAIDITEVDEATKEVVNSLKESVNKLSANRPSSFDPVLNSIKTLRIDKISNTEIYQKIINIIGNPQEPNTPSNLSTAAVIAHNIGHINIITDLQNERIEWTQVIDQVEEITRLGADMERDLDGTPLDAGRDIDPNGQLVKIISYSGKSRNSTIEVHGDGFGKNSYDQKSFTLLADLVDAFEASKYFQDVIGFSFTKEEDRQGAISSPLNFELTIQDKTITDERDLVRKVEIEKIDELSTQNIDTEVIDEIDFSIENDSGDVVDSEEENTAEEETVSE